MTKFSGRIYPHVLVRFAKITIIPNWLLSIRTIGFLGLWIDFPLGKLLEEMIKPMREVIRSPNREVVIDMSFLSAVGPKGITAGWDLMLHKFFAQNNT